MQYSSFIFFFVFLCIVHAFMHVTHTYSQMQPLECIFSGFCGFYSSSFSLWTRSAHCWLNFVTCCCLRHRISWTIISNNLRTIHSMLIGIPSSELLACIVSRVCIDCVERLYETLWVVCVCVCKLFVALLCMFNVFCGVRWMRMRFCRLYWFLNVFYSLFAFFVVMHCVASYNSYAMLLSAF